MAVRVLRVSTYTAGGAGPSFLMLGPVADGGLIEALTAPGCLGPIITPHLKGAHEVTRPVAVEGAMVGDAIAIKIKRVRLLSRASSSGTSERIEGRRYFDGPFVATKCPNCGMNNPPTFADGIGPDAIKCKRCGAVAIPIRVTCGYTMVFDEGGALGITIDKQKAQEIARQAREYAALPENSEQHSILTLATADLAGILTRVRPLVGNIGTTPAIDICASHNSGDLYHRDLAPHLGALSDYGPVYPLTDAHMDIDSVREGAILICPVKANGGGVYIGDVHAMQGDGELAGHTTDVSAEVTLQVEVIKGLAIAGPILLPRAEDLPSLSKPFGKDELEKGHRMAEAWGVELEDVAPIQIVGSGPDLNLATRVGLERASSLLCMSLEEVRNRATITGAVEVGRAPGVVTVSLLAPTRQLDRLGILNLIKEQYSS